jgi:hypothetical protein
MAIMIRMARTTMAMINSTIVNPRAFEFLFRVYFPFIRRSYFISISDPAKKTLAMKVVCKTRSLWGLSEKSFEPFCPAK